MPATHDDDVIFTLVKDEISACATELGVSREQIAYGILREMRRILDLEFGCWPAADIPVSAESPECPLALHCYPSCYWWDNGDCTFPKEAGTREKGMNQTINPYPKFLIDEMSGLSVSDTRHEIWAAGYRAGTEDILNTRPGEYPGNDRRPGHKTKEAQSSHPRSAIKATPTQ